MKQNHKTVLRVALLFFGAIGLFLFLSSVAGISVLDPKGLIADEERNLIVFATFLMLTVVIPVFLITGFFAWTYRASNEKAKYSPDWEHSKIDELIWWAVPFVLISILAVVTWRTTHELDPYRPLHEEGKPITVQVVALDWKWLFIYPEQGIASVNYLEIPVDTAINFELSADAPMNSFWVPQLSGQIYAMPGMETKLHIIADELGSYWGNSANFSGAGFSGMNFLTRVVTQEGFRSWIDDVKSSGLKLDWDTYTELAKRTINHPVTFYSSVEGNLFERIMLKFMMPGMEQRSMEDMNMDMGEHISVR